MVSLQNATMKFSPTHLLLVFAFTLLTFSPSGTFAQTTKLNDKLSFSVNNVTVSDALEALTRVTGNAFSYNPDQLPANRIVRVDIRNRPLIEILSAIIGSTGFGFRQMGNQIIIYRNKDEVPETTEDKPEDQTEKLNQNVSKGQLPEKVIIKHDTIIKEVRDTVKLTEYVIKRDTVYEKVTTPVSRNEVFRTNLSEEITPSWKFCTGVNVSYYFPSSAFQAPAEYSARLADFEDSYSYGVFSGSLGIDVLASYNRFSAGSGIGMTVLSEKLDYSYLKETGGFFQKDTLDSYYTLLEGDTTWYYILDSAYIPKDNERFSYKVNNHFRYLEIPLTLQYNYPFRNILVYGKAGIIAGIHVGSDGQQIRVPGEGIVQLSDLKAKSLLFSYTVAVGAAIPITQKIVLSTSLSWRNHLSSIYKDFPIDIRYRALGINATIYYKLY